MTYDEAKLEVLSLLPELGEEFIYHGMPTATEPRVVWGSKGVVIEVTPSTPFGLGSVVLEFRFGFGRVGTAWTISGWWHALKVRALRPANYNNEDNASLLG